MVGKFTPTHPPVWPKTDEPKNQKQSANKQKKPANATASNLKSKQEITEVENQNYPFVVQFKIAYLLCLSFTLVIENQ
jgi:hypothetical protein